MTLWYPKLISGTYWLTPISTAWKVASNGSDFSTSSYLEDDFDIGQNTSLNLGRLHWTVNIVDANNTITDVAAAAGMIGVKLFFKNGNGTPTTSVSLPETQVIGNQGNLSIMFRSKNPLCSAVQNAIYRYGLGAATLGADGSGLYFRATDTLNWYAVVRNGATETAVDTGIIHTAVWHTFKINSTGSSVTFYIDNVLKATITTNIPTTATLFPCASIQMQGNQLGYMNLDYFYISITGLSR